ncbi:MAG: UDP-glucose dehydrogenase family protein [Candidatus Glassbacteria bacterium]
MHISMIGTGYVGLVSGACFAEFGIEVICVDKDKGKIDKLNNGIIPIYEPGLDVIISKNVKEGRLKFTTDIADSIKNSLVIFIAVGTPPKDDGSPDLGAVWEVAGAIADNMNDYKVIVNKSTVPVGTGKRLKEFLEANKKQEVNFSIVSNPEFLREGSAIEDFMRPDRVVIGAEDTEAIAIMKDLYSPLYLIETPILITNIESAEMIKYAANAFLATKISFINEVSILCEIVGADVHQVALGMGLDNRVGKKFLHPGPGFGGSCFPKDTKGFIQMAREHDYDLKIVKATIEVNDIQKKLSVKKIIRALGDDVNGKKIGVLGLSFKPNTDDMRDAPSIPIINSLIDHGAVIKAYDPVAMEESKKILNNSKMVYCNNSYEVAEGSDALVFMTEWNQFRKLDMEKIKNLLAQPIMVDLRNIYDPRTMREMGFSYFGVGR